MRRMLGVMQPAPQLPAGGPSSAVAQPAEGRAPPDALPATSAAELAEAAVRRSELALLQRHVLQTLEDHGRPGSGVLEGTAVAMLAWLMWNQEAELHPDLGGLIETSASPSLSLDLFCLLAACSETVLTSTGTALAPVDDMLMEQHILGRCVGVGMEPQAYEELTADEARMHGDPLQSARSMPVNFEVTATCWLAGVGVHACGAS